MACGSRLIRWAGLDGLRVDVAWQEQVVEARLFVEEGEDEGGSGQKAAGEAGTGRAVGEG